LMYYRNVISYSDTSKNDESSFVVPPFTFERHQGFHTDFAKHGNFYFSSPLPKLHLLLLLSDKIYMPLNNTSQENPSGEEQRYARRVLFRSPIHFLSGSRLGLTTRKYQRKKFFFCADVWITSFH
jgi:hypothetical protein